ncbi:MAG: hypothetical protein QGG64_07430, partial [Candidatus Latescibacteria bacterium]|nr:hypothetical protein [Candidatus Latescibacterota bacterium]
RQLYVGALFMLWATATVYLAWNGADYYRVPLSDRPFASDHKVLKPGGSWGHGLGIIGSMMMIAGVAIYGIRKRVRWMVTWGNLRDWLTFHIFLCVTGATLITFHTAFKVGGLVAISFWCMVGVVVSGVLGRYVYVRIPRDQTGQALTAGSLQKQCETMREHLQHNYKLSPDVLAEIDAVFARSGRGILRLIQDDCLRYMRLRRVKHLLRSHESSQAIHDIIRLVKQRASLMRTLHFYTTAQKVLHYWHVIHLPFTVVMFLIMFVHVAVAIMFGYRWIL